MHYCFQGHKGEKKQNIWVNNLRGILAEATDLDGDVRNIVNTIMDHENIPRKQAKFVNFVKNIMRNKARPHSIDKTWELFSQALKPSASEEEKVAMEVDENKAGDGKETQEVETKVKSKKEKKKKKEKALEQPSEEETSEKENIQKHSKKNKKSKQDAIGEENSKKLKRKREEEMEVDRTIDTEETPGKKTKFDWDETISSVLKQKGDEMKLNKLKKKCVAEYLAQHEGTHKTAEEIGAKFDKKLKKRKYRVLKDKVKLITEETEDVSEKAEETKLVPTETKKPVIEAKPKDASFNNWESANLGSSTQNEKFRRLMGIKNPTKEGGGKFGGENRNDKKIFRDLEQGFEKARQMHFGGRCFES